MAVVYELALSPFVQKVKIALREKGVAFETRGVQVPGFEEGNPRREVPLFVDGNTRIWDSTVILDYIDERWPEPPLLPPDPTGRAEVRLLEELADTRLEALNFCIAEVTGFPAGEDAAAAAVVERSRAELARLHGVLADRLGEKSYFGGDRPDRADISLLPHLNASRVMKNGPDDGPLGAWLERMNARPAVQATVQEVKAGIAELKQLMARVASGEAQRRVRDHRLDWLMSAGGAPIVMKRLAEGSIRFSSLD